MAGRWLWTVRRFGLTPHGLRQRLLPAGRGRPVFCVSIPKSGTHLLERALCLHPDLYRRLLPTLHPFNVARHGGLEHVLARTRPHQILVTHLYATPDTVAAVRASGAAALFMQRDPRDVLLSLVFYAGSVPKHPLHRPLAALPDVKHRLLLLIRGDRGAGIPSVGERLDAFTGWMSEDILPVRFEDLIGARGAGDAALQTRVLRRIWEHAGVPVAEARLQRAAGLLHHRSSPTFRKGAIGQWREHFDDEVAAAFDDAAGPGMRQLGYA